ncbi:MAG: hypothetical protein WC588_03005 [Candidatus Micrarchaeia archaeon]
MASVSAEKEEMSFSARYALPAQVAANLESVSWETVVQLSSDFSANACEKSSRVKKLVKELQLERMLLMERIRRGSRDGRIDPKLLVDAIRLIEKCEYIAEDYEVDLREFSKFLYMVTEKLKKEKLARHAGKLCEGRIAPISEELSSFKTRGEGAANGKGKNRRKRK